MFAHEGTARLYARPLGASRFVSVSNLMRFAESILMRLAEVIGYSYVFLVFAGTLIPFFAAVCAIPLLLGGPLLGWRRSGQLLLRATLFFCLLHAFSLPANALMVGVFRDRLYYSADPVVDFLPYMPLSGFVTDEVCGGHLLNGYTEGTFVAVWSALAIPVWFATVVMFRRLIARCDQPSN